MTAGLSAFGTTLKWNGTALAELTSISGPKIKVDTKDMTNHDSASAAREFIATLVDGGEIKIEGHFIPGDTAGQIAFITDMLARTTRQAIITAPAAAAFTWTFNAIATDYEPTYPDDGNLGFTASLKVTGLPVLGITYAGDLTGLTITTATLLPTLTASVYSYTATTTGTSVTVTPTYATATSIEVWAGTSIATLALVSVLASGGTSSAIAIAGVGTNVAIQIRVKKTGYATRVYNVTLVKTA
jgi:hypothetical protein